MSMITMRIINTMSIINQLASIIGAHSLQTVLMFHFISFAADALPTLLIPLCFVGHSCKEGRENMVPTDHFH
jgi:hypothetical protein